MSVNQKNELVISLNERAEHFNKMSVNQKNELIISLNEWAEDFTEQLARELAEAKAELAKAGVGDYKADYFLGELTLTGQLAEVTKQRDALAEALERLKKLPEKWRNECNGNWLRGGVVLQLADDFEAATKGGGQ